MWIPFGVFTDVLKPSFFLFSLLLFQLTYFFWSPCFSPGCVCLQTRCDKHIREWERGKRKPIEEGKFVISLLKSCHIFHPMAHPGLNVDSLVPGIISSSLRTRPHSARLFRTQTFKQFSSSIWRAYSFVFRIISALG